MSYEEFWYKDVRLVEYYRKAQELRMRRENEAHWLQGLYIYEALCDASPLFRTSFKKEVVKPVPYAKEPYPITEQEIKERKEREEALKQERMKAAFACFATKIAQRQMPPRHNPN